MHTTYPSLTKFQQFVELKDYRPPTKKEYIRYVRKLAEHFGCDPLTLSEEQLRQYFLFLRQDKHYSRSPMKAAKFSLRSFFLDCHQRAGWTVFAEVRIAEPLVLPVVLSREEVAAVLGAVREPRIGVGLELIYHHVKGFASRGGLRPARGRGGARRGARPAREPFPPPAPARALRQGRRGSLRAADPAPGATPAPVVAAAPASHLAVPGAGPRLARTRPHRHGGGRQSDHASVGLGGAEPRKRLRLTRQAV